MYGVPDGSELTDNVVNLKFVLLPVDQFLVQRSRATHCYRGPVHVLHDRIHRSSDWIYRKTILVYMTGLKVLAAGR